tara:strand:- start:411 stop:731 length:321 start_codon:yes stop_codon:yes gene_type:complete
MMYFLSCPPVYTLPGTWQKFDPITCKAYVIPIGHLEGGAAFLVFIGVCVLALIGYGIYTTFGSGGKNLRDQIKEHARMHEMGIAHGHNDNGAFPSVKTKHQHKHEE